MRARRRHHCRPRQERPGRAHRQAPPRPQRCRRRPAEPSPWHLPPIFHLQPLPAAAPPADPSRASQPRPPPPPAATHKHVVLMGPGGMQMRVAHALCRRYEQLVAWVLLGCLASGAHLQHRPTLQLLAHLLRVERRLELHGGRCCAIGQLHWEAVAPPPGDAAQQLCSGPYAARQQQQLHADGGGAAGAAVGGDGGAEGGKAGRRGYGGGGGGRMAAEARAAVQAAVEWAAARAQAQQQALRAECAAALRDALATCQVRCGAALGAQLVVAVDVAWHSWCHGAAARESRIANQVGSGTRAPCVSIRLAHQGVRVVCGARPVRAWLAG